MVDDFLRLTCNECGQETKHDVLIRREIDRDGDPPFVTDTYELLECRGCEEITLRRLRRFNPFDNTEERTFPSRSARRIPKFVWRLPEDVEALMREVYVALDEGSRRLAMMGARAVIDIVATNQIGDVGSFAKKLAALESSGAISHKQYEMLDAALGVGSAAAHRGYKPNIGQAELVMDIVEHLLESTYRLADLANALKKGTPPRRS